MEIKWSEERPTELGYYVYADRGHFKELQEIHEGLWKSAQNPNALYANDSLLSEMRGSWYGPIPHPYSEIINCKSPLQ